MRPPDSGYCVLQIEAALMLPLTIWGRIKRREVLVRIDKNAVRRRLHASGRSNCPLGNTRSLESKRAGFVL